MTVGVTRMRTCKRRVKVMELFILSFSRDFFKVKSVGDLCEIGAHWLALAPAIRVIGIWDWRSSSCRGGGRGFVGRRVGEDEFDLMRSVVFLFFNM